MTTSAWYSLEHLDMKFSIFPQNKTVLTNALTEVFLTLVCKTVIFVSVGTLLTSMAELMIRNVTLSAENPTILLSTLKIRLSPVVDDGEILSTLVSQTLL